MTNNDEIEKLAREYAEEIYPYEEFEDIGQMGFLRNTAKKNAADFMQFLLRTHCIVPKSLVMEEYNDASTDIEEAIKYNMRISEAAMGKKELLESLFDAETFKDSEV